MGYVMERWGFCGFERFPYSASVNIGWYRIEVANEPDVGVGGSNVQYVTLGHICSQTLINSEHT